MKLFVANKQKAHRVDHDSVRRFLSLVAWKLQRMSPGTEWADLTLVLTDNAGIREINRRHLDSTDVTDVISFRYAPVPGEDNRACGDVFVNVERAVEKGPAFGNSSRELALYIAHGCDHLAGHSDNTKAGYIRMRRRELRWLKVAASEGMLRPLLAAGTGRAQGHRKP